MEFSIHLQITGLLIVYIIFVGGIKYDEGIK
jgi:hypothetical protein